MKTSVKKEAVSIKFADHPDYVQAASMSDLDSSFFLAVGIGHLESLIRLKQNLEIFQHSYEAFQAALDQTELKFHNFGIEEHFKTLRSLTNMMMKPDTSIITALDWLDQFMRTNFQKAADGVSIAYRCLMSYVHPANQERYLHGLSVDPQIDEQGILLLCQKLRIHIALIIPTQKVRFVGIDQIAPAVHLLYYNHSFSVAYHSHHLQEIEEPITNYFPFVDQPESVPNNLNSNSSCAKNSESLLIDLILAMANKERNNELLRTLIQQAIDAYPQLNVPDLHDFPVSALPNIQFPPSQVPVNPPNLGIRNSQPNIQPSRKFSPNTNQLASQKNSIAKSRDLGGQLDTLSQNPKPSNQQNPLNFPVPEMKKTKSEHQNPGALNTNLPVLNFSSQSFSEAGKPMIPPPENKPLEKQCQCCRETKDKEEFDAITCSKCSICSRCHAEQYMKGELKCPGCGREYSDNDVTLLTFVAEYFFPNQKAVEKRDEDSFWCKLCRSRKHFTQKNFCYYLCDACNSCTKGKEVCPLCQQAFSQQCSGCTEFLVINERVKMQCGHQAHSVCQQRRCLICNSVNV